MVYWVPPDEEWVQAEAKRLMVGYEPPEITAEMLGVGGGDYKPCPDNPHYITPEMVGCFTNKETGVSMGTDMWGAVGRLKPEQEQQVETTAAQFAFFGNRKVSFADFEFYSGDETNFVRDRRVYDFLGDCFPNIGTMPDIEAKQKDAAAFVTWLNLEFAKIPREQRPCGVYTNGPAYEFMSGEIHDALHHVGERDYTLHFIKDLVEFDYDRLVESKIEGYASQTYRQLFSGWYFKFLEWAVSEKWDFVIVGFSY